MYFSEVMNERIIGDIEDVRTKAEEYKLGEKLGSIGVGVE
jgi:hypothetical protein